uniref:Uncharacterized protein n=1 Tax=Trichuris muris TaxID=70415 RepID=A0A5S6R533_TRIMR
MQLRHLHTVKQALQVSRISMQTVWTSIIFTARVIKRIISIWINSVVTNLKLFVNSGAFERSSETWNSGGKASMQYIADIKAAKQRSMILSQLRI